MKVEVKKQKNLCFRRLNALSQLKHPLSGSNSCDLNQIYLSYWKAFSSFPLFYRPKVLRRGGLVCRGTFHRYHGILVFIEMPNMLHTPHDAFIPPRMTLCSSPDILIHSMIMSWTGYEDGNSKILPLDHSAWWYGEAFFSYFFFLHLRLYNTPYLSLQPY